MNIDKKITKPYSILFFLLLAILIIYFISNKFQKERNESMALKPISINLLTSVHPDLSWKFEPIESKIVVKPGAVTTIEYIVENLGNKRTTGIATFAYFPNDFGGYINKINCFCYDAKTLEPKQKDKYTLILLIDPEVTKDSKTKSIKEVTIQFTFFDYKKNKS